MTDPLQASGPSNRPAGGPPSAPPWEGGCLCGSIRYRLTSEPLTVYVCHCLDCQRHTGTAFGLSAIVTADSLEILSGKPTESSVVRDGGRRKRFEFCGSCSTRLWGKPAAADGFRILRPGTLDPGHGLEPVAQIWASRAKAWLETPSDLVTFEGQPGAFGPLFEAWKRRAQ